jgi:hypothetical protein
MGGLSFQRPAERGVSKNLRRGSQADTDSWNRLCDSQLGPMVGGSGLSQKRVDTPLKIAVFIADFRRLKFTHNGTHVLDEVTDTRKLQCEVFFPLPLTIAESHCTRLSGSSVRFREAMMR